jgi:hypothetical protein
MILSMSLISMILNVLRFGPGLLLMIALAVLLDRETKKRWWFIQDFQVALSQNFILKTINAEDDHLKQSKNLKMVI